MSLTLTALAGELPGFQLARQKQHGWIPTFFNPSSGDSRMSQVSTTACLLGSVFTPTSPCFSLWDGSASILPLGWSTKCPATDYSSPDRFEVQQVEASVLNAQLFPAAGVVFIPFW